MLALYAVAGLSAGAVLGIVTVEWIKAGPTWEDWSDARPGPVGVLAQVLLVAAFAAGVLGLGLPAEARAFGIAFSLGGCLVFALEGVRRWRFAPRPDPAAIPDVGRWERWMGRDLPEVVRPDDFPPSLGETAFYAALGIGAGLLLGLRGAMLLVGVALALAKVWGEALVEHASASSRVRRDRRTWDQSWELE